MRARWHACFCLQEAGIPVKLAPTIGIAVDHRRHNKCVESLQVNVARLKVYKAKLIVFPRRSKKTKVRDRHAAWRGVTVREWSMGLKTSSYTALNACDLKPSTPYFWNLLVLPSCHCQKRKNIYG